MLIIDLDVAFDGIGQVLGGVEAGVVARTSAMRPLKRSIMPLVWGVLSLVSRCSMRLSVQTRSKAWAPVGWCSPVAQKRKVARGGCRLVLKDLHVNPARRPINGSEQVAALLLVRHRRAQSTAHTP